MHHIIQSLQKTFNEKTQQTVDVFKPAVALILVFVFDYSYINSNSSDKSFARSCIYYLQSCNKKLPPCLLPLYWNNQATVCKSASFSRCLVLWDAVIIKTTIIKISLHIIRGFVVIYSAFVFSHWKEQNIHIWLNTKTYYHHR